MYFIDNDLSNLYHIENLSAPIVEVVNPTSIYTFKVNIPDIENYTYIGIVKMWTPSVNYYNIGHIRTEENNSVIEVAVYNRSSAGHNAGLKLSLLYFRNM